MPMIDVTAASDLFPAGSEETLAHELTRALLSAEGVDEPTSLHLDNTGAYFHFLPPTAVFTARGSHPKTVRVQIVTPPGVLTREGQKRLVAEVTQIVARVAGDPEQARRTWVLLTEAAEGGWGIAGTAFGKAEFAALARR